MKKKPIETKQYYEIILLFNGGCVELSKTSSFDVYKGEYVRLESIAKTNPGYELIVNLYDFNNRFEKRVK